MTQIPIMILAEFDNNDNAEDDIDNDNDSDDAYDIVKQ